MRLLLLNATTDLDDPFQAFTTGWIRALAARIESIDVVTMRAGRIEVPANVRVKSLGRERGYSRLRRAMMMQRCLLEILSANPVDACFSHMSPAMTILAAPILKFKGVPIVTWFLHQQVSSTLRAAHHLSDVMVTSNEELYPYHRNKIVALGHGIDMKLFSAIAEVDLLARPLIVSVGRLSPYKDQLTLVEAIGMLSARGRDVECELVGPSDPSCLEYTDQLETRILELELTRVVRLVGAVPYETLAERYRRSFAHVNLCMGGLDKTALEAMACGVPSLVANDGYRETLGAWAEALLFEPGNPTDLAAKIEGLLDTREPQRRAMCSSLAANVREMHGLDRLAENLLQVLRDAASRRRGTRSDSGAER